MRAESLQEKDRCLEVISQVREKEAARLKAAEAKLFIAAETKRRAVGAEAKSLRLAADAKAKKLAADAGGGGGVEPEAEIEAGGRNCKVRKDHCEIGKNG